MFFGFLADLIIFNWLKKEVLLWNSFISLWESLIVMPACVCVATIGLSDCVRGLSNRCVTITQIGATTTKNNNKSNRTKPCNGNTIRQNENVNKLKSNKRTDRSYNCRLLPAAVAATEQNTLYHSLSPSPTSLSTCHKRYHFVSIFLVALRQQQTKDRKQDKTKKKKTFR